MLEIKSTLRRAPLFKGARRLSYERMLEYALGKKYDLSLVICADALAKRINKEYRKKFYAPNVLSFPLSRSEGEIFLNAAKAEREARLFGVSREERLALLFVHGLFHLKGLSHGRTMQANEARVLRAFGFKWHGASTRE